MDFGVLGLEGGGGTLSCSDTSCLTISSLSSSNEATKTKWYRSGIEHDLREFKDGKTSDDFSASKAMLLQQQKNSSLRSNGHGLLSEGHQQHQMLSFSSPNSQIATLPYYTSSAYSRNTGYSSGRLSGESMHGVFNGFRGPFAPSQWMELELQALIYKFISSNVPVPSYLLNPIRKAMDSAGLSSFPGLRTNTLGWGAFHLGFSSNTDPEPGRCRRTDGKKWRCSRDAVADQKYCERHMNRGRHRSRKPVEGQAGHSVSGSSSASNAKLPVASTATAMGVPGGGASNSLGLAQHQVSNLQSGGTNPSSAFHQFDRNLFGKANLSESYHDKTNLSILSPSMSLKHQYSISKQQNPGEKSAWTDFGIVCSDSLLNPLNKSSSLITSRNYGSTKDLDDRDNKSQHSLRQFMDDWPRNRSESSAVSLSNIDVQSDRTQLSISIPRATSDYVSATSSPNNEKLANSPQRLLPELEATQMGLGVGTLVTEQNNRQVNWIPSSWQSSMGGPLGEVLHTTNNGTSNCKDASALNLMIDGWDSSPRMASSPTGILQKSAFCSLSNSSAGSSPRPENNKTSEGATLCNGLLGSTLLNPVFPAL